MQGHIRTRSRDDCRSSAGRIAASSAGSAATAAKVAAALTAITAACISGKADRICIELIHCVVRHNKLRRAARSRAAIAAITAVNCINVARRAGATTSARSACCNVDQIVGRETSQWPRHGQGGRSANRIAAIRSVSNYRPIKIAALATGR